MTDQTTPPRVMHPGPVPTAVDLATTKIGDQHALVVSVSTPQGVQHFFFDTEQAAKLGRSIMAAARDLQALEAVTQSKLTIPGRG